MGVIRAFVMAALAATCTALVETLDVHNDDRAHFHITSFGFEPKGVFEMTIDHFQLMIPQHNYQQPADDQFRLAFVLKKAGSKDTAVRSDAERRGAYCLHEDDVERGDLVISLAKRTQWQTLSISHTITKGGYYNLYFSNCEKGTNTNFKMDLAEYNMDVDGSTKIYLSAGQQSLPNWFFALCFLFTAQLGVWSRVICKDRNNTKSLHWLMMVVLVLKILTLFCESFKFYSLMTTGHNNAWSIFFYIFSALKGVLLFAVIVLIGTGWSYLKPFLTDRDKQLMLAVMVAQIMVNVAMVVLDETAPGSADWLTWSDILHLVDMVCCCLILLPIVWSIRHLREAESTDGKAMANMNRLKNFRTFYLSVVSYIYFTRIVVYLLDASLPFELSWLGTVFAELAAFAFYGVSGYLFRPQSANPYLALDTEEVEMEAKATA